jgi:hypothetical protein
VSGSPGKPPAYAGTDFIIVRDGKIAAVYLFFDKLRIASPEMLPNINLLPHLICSFWASGGKGGYEAGEHDDT